MCLIGSLSLSLLQSKSVSRSQCVKAGTEEKLVLHLLHSFAMGDSSFIAVFLSTFRSFTSTRRVLEILIDRWGTRGPHPTTLLGRVVFMLELSCAVAWFLVVLCCNVALWCRTGVGFLCPYEQNNEDRTGGRNRKGMICSIAGLQVTPVVLCLFICALWFCVFSFLSSSLLSSDCCKRNPVNLLLLTANTQL